MVNIMVNLTNTYSFVPDICYTLCYSYLLFCYSIVTFTISYYSTSLEFEPNYKNNY